MEPLPRIVRPLFFHSRFFFCLLPTFSPPPKLRLSSNLSPLPSPSASAAALRLRRRLSPSPLPFASAMARKTRSGARSSGCIEDPVLPQSRLNKKSLSILKKGLVPTGRRGETVVRLATYPPAPEANETVIFASFIAAGLLPPFSAFFLAVLEDFGVQLLHLSPNSIVILAVFAHLCEMFVGVMPSVPLFRHYFVLQPAARDQAIGSCCFRLRDGLAEEYIPHVLRNKWDEWRSNWCYVAVDPHARLALPTGPPAPDKGRWERPPADEDDLVGALVRISDLRDHGLTASMVLGDYLRRRLAPLRDRGRAAWMYTGDMDFGRTQTGADSNLLSGVLDTMMKVLLGSKPGVYHLPRPDLALCDNATRDDIIAMLPEFDAWGVRRGSPGRARRQLNIPETGGLGGRSAAASPGIRGADEDPQVRKGKRPERSPSPVSISSSDSPPGPPPPGAGGSSSGQRRPATTPSPTGARPGIGVRPTQWRFSGPKAP